MRFFNTAGPCAPEWHYVVPPELRLPDALRLIARQQYFVAHAPRQTGKTTLLLALTRDLCATGQRLALYVSCGRAAPTGDDYEAAAQEVLMAIRHATVRMRVSPELRPPDPWPDASPGSRLNVALSDWATRCPVPIVLFLDEIDALTGVSLVSVLQQLRDGYPTRPRNFPASVVLCGQRTVCLGSFSPFNILASSFRISDFTSEQVADLYAQHTSDTGQEFTAEAIERAFEYTQGQPWLVNALAGEIIDQMRIEPPEPITADHMDQAKERLILARSTHLDSLVAKLQEPRVQRVIEPLLAGTPVNPDFTYSDDVSYARDLGLIAKTRPARIANPIYHQVIVRVLHT